MTTRYSHNVEECKCKLCDIVFSKPYNFRRHLVRIHGFLLEDYIEHINENNTNNQQNNNKEHKCNKCNKIFSRNWNLTKHLDRCKGIIDKYSCQYCNKKFKHNNSRFAHYKICKTKKEIDEKKEKVSNTIIKTITFEINKNENRTNKRNGIVYLVQPEELIDTNRYKVGCSSKTSIERLKTYKKGMNCILVAKCIEPFIVEKEIIKEFNNSFNVIAGKEYYEGNESEMKAKFIEVYLKHSC